MRATGTSRPDQLERALGTNSVQRANLLWIVVGAVSTRGTSGFRETVALANATKVEP